MTVKMHTKSLPQTSKKLETYSSDENLDSNAYPNNDQYMHIPGQHNTNKWLQAVRDIYYKEKNGLDRVNAVRQATSGWNTMETFDFLNWFKFYEEGSHLKYKMANLWYENGTPGYFLHVKPDPVKQPEPQTNGRDIDFARESAANEMSSSEKKQIIEKQRAKIIGRLDSAEKLLRSQEGQLFAGKELETLMEAIYTLKKKVQLVNKISTATKLYEDMIVREANVLNRKGFTKAANVLYSVAEDAALTPAATPLPTGGAGAPGGLPSMGPGMPQTPPESAPNNPPSVEEDTAIPPGIKEFLERIESANVTDDDELEVIDESNAEDEELVVKEAQAIPPIDVPMTTSPAPAPQNPRKPFTPAEDISAKPSKPDAPSPPLPEPKDEPLEVSEEDIPAPGAPVTEPSPNSNFDAKLDELMANVTVADVVAELESLSKIFKTREIPRRLSRADMMLDSLGLAPFFPSLSEAQNKSLEANNYIATRVDDILAKLRGSLSAKEIDLQGTSPAENPELTGIKNKLKSDDDKEKARKQMRKDQESAELSSKQNPTKETPEVEIAEDLAAPPGPPPGPKPPV